MREYEVEAHQRAIRLGDDADRAATVAASANRNADLYVLHTVLFSTIILLASLAPRLRRRRPRRALLVLSAVGLLFALASIALQPFAWLGA
jgi:hypothetical protein